MKFLFFLKFLFLTQFFFAQDSIEIKGSFYNNTKYSKVIVQKFGVGTFNVALIPIINNSILIKAPKNTPPGIYRFQYSEVENDFIDIIINGSEKEIHFELDVNNKDKTLTFIKSEENNKWYAYKLKEDQLLIKISAIQYFLMNFPDQNDKIWLNNFKSYQKLQKLFMSQRNDFLISNSGYWAINMVKNKPIFFPDVKKHWKIQDFEARERFWDKINVSDINLQNSPLYTELILDYLRYYMNPEMKFTEQEMIEGFIKSADDIMNVFSKNEDSQKFALQFLQLGFKEMGQEKVLQYLDEKYAVLASQCQDDKNKEAFEARMAGYKAMQKGTLAPNIFWASSNGKQASLDDINTDKILLVFWASWCPHCLETMPKINYWAKNNPNVSVLAISLDTDFKLYQKQALAFDQMYHYCDYKQWESKPVMDYYVYGTPTMILIDKNKNIEAKFSSDIEMFNYFKH